MNISGKTVLLRAIEAEDLPSLHRWSNDPEVQQGLAGWHFPVSKAALQRWVEGFRHDGTDQRFIIEAPSAGSVGLVTLTAINWKDRNAFHGLLIGERDQRRKGFAADALLAIMRYAFEQLGLQRLDTTIAEFNAASLALHVDRCGWIVEGKKAQALFRNNRYWSNIVLGMTRGDFESGLAAGRFRGP